VPLCQTQNDGRAREVQTGKTSWDKKVVPNNVSREMNGEGRGQFAAIKAKGNEKKMAFGQKNTKRKGRKSKKRWHTRGGGGGKNGSSAGGKKKGE